MRTRPWPLILLAVFQILAPAGTIFFNAWALGVKPHYVLSWILERPAGQIFETLCLMPIAGLAIYQMKAWSYAVFLAAMGWSIYANLRNWHYAAHAIPMWKALIVYGFQIALAGYFMIPSVRRTYLDRSVRWWEAKRRFTLRSPITLLINGQAKTATMQNISEGGVLLQSEEELRTGQEITLRFSVIEVPYEIRGVIRYALNLPQGGRGYGVQFSHTRETLHRMNRMVRGLELIGVVDRDQAYQKPWHQSMKDWIVQLLKTGKGITPEIRSARKG